MLGTQKNINIFEWK